MRDQTANPQKANVPRLGSFPPVFYRAEIKLYILTVGYRNINIMNSSSQEERTRKGRRLGKGFKRPISVQALDDGN
jgi:hypothetical protein